MLGNNNAKKYRELFFLNFKDGKIVRTKGVETDSFDFVEGNLEKIFRKERDFRGEMVTYWYMDMRDDSGDLYRLAFPFRSGVFKSIILSLAGDEDLTSLSPIRIETYQKEGKTKVTVWDGENKLDWITRELPPVRFVNIGGTEYKDDSERMDFIVSLVGRVRSKIGDRSEVVE